jgi:hypothetical protein
MVESVNRQSATEIFNVLSQAESRGKDVRVNDQGKVVIANFGNKIAEAFRGIGKDADWKAQRRSDVASQVVARYCEALESEAVVSVKSPREWRIAESTLNAVFRNHNDEVGQSVRGGVVPAASRFQALLTEKRADAETSLTESEGRKLRKLIREVNDGSIQGVADGLKTSDRQQLSKKLSYLNQQVSNLREHFLTEQKNYAEAADPTDEQATALKDLGNTLAKLEEIVQKGVASARDANPDNWVGDEVTVPDRAYGRENFSIRGDVRRAISNGVTALNDLQGIANTQPGLVKLDAFLDRFLGAANDIGEVTDTEGQMNLLSVAIDAQNRLEDLAAILEEDGNLSPKETETLNKAFDLFNNLVDTLDDDNAAQQVRFGTKDDLSIGDAADAPGYRVELGPVGFRDNKMDAQANAIMDGQYQDPVASVSGHVPKNARTTLNLDQRVATTNERWNATMAAEPKADRTEFKPSDERFVRGDTSEIDGVQDDLTPPEVTLNKDDPQPAKSNLRKS